MPAIVIPVVAVESRARLTGRWLAACTECDWFPDQYFDEGVATQDGEEHNRVRHDCASVTFERNLPLKAAESHLWFLETTLRSSRRMSYGMVAFFSAIVALLFGGVVVGGIFAMYGLMLCRQGMWVGKWSQRLTAQQEEVTRLASGEADDDSES